MGEQVSAAEQVRRSTYGSEIVELPDLLQSLCDARRTGTLQVWTDERTVYVHLQEGDVAAAWDGDPAFLKRALVETNALSGEELEEFQSFTGASAATLERRLLQQGRIDEEALIVAHQHAITEVVCGLFSLKAPHTKLRDGPPLPELARVNLPHPRVRLSTKPLVMEGVRRLDDWERIRSFIPADEDVPAVARLPGDVDAAGAEILDLVDGVRDAGEVAARASRSACEAMELLANLVEEGVLRLMEPQELMALFLRLRTEPTGAEGADAPSREKLLRLALRAEGLGFSNTESSLWLARAFEERGELKRSQQRYVTLARQLRDIPENRHEASGYLQKALELQPDDGALQRELIETLLAQDRLEEAAFQAETYIDWLRGRGDPLAALKAVRGLLEPLEEFEEIAILRAELELDAGNRLQAARRYQEIVDQRLDGDEYTFEEKVGVLERLAEIDARAPGPHYDLAVLLAEHDSGRAVEEARACIRWLKAEEPRPARPTLVEAYALLHRLEPTPRSAADLAIAYVEDGSVERAAELLREVIAGGEELDPEVVPAFRRLFLAKKGADTHRMMAEALLRSGDTKRGLAEMRTLASRTLHAGDKPGALRAYRRALRYDPFDRAIRSDMVRVLDEPGQRAPRLQNLRALARIAEVQGDLDLVISALEEFVQEEPDDLTAGRDLIRSRVKRDGAEALEPLREFAVESDARRNRGDVAWAVERARRLQAPAEWFDGLPVDTEPGTSSALAGRRGPAP